MRGLKAATAAIDTDEPPPSSSNHRRRTADAADAADARTRSKTDYDVIRGEDNSRSETVKL